MNYYTSSLLQQHHILHQVGGLSYHTDHLHLRIHPHLHLIMNMRVIELDTSGVLLHQQNNRVMLEYQQQYMQEVNYSMHMLLHH